MFIAILFTTVRPWKQPIYSPTDEWIKKLWYMYKGILLSHKKEHIWVSYNEVNEPRVYCTEWSKSEREKQILHINAYIWNLKKWYWRTYLQGRNGDTDEENGLVHTVWEGESEMNGESGINTYTLWGVRWTAGEKPLCSAGSPAWSSAMTWRDGMGEGKEARAGREGMCV